MKGFKEMLEINESSDEQILSKVSKKAFGGGFRKVVDQGDGYYTISLSTDIVTFKELKTLEINLSSFELDNIEA
jgi:hypothetical protein